MGKLSASLSMQFIDSVSDAREEPGIYALWCREGGSLTLLNIRESENIKLSLLRYQQIQRWRVHGANRIVFSARYTPGRTQAQRQLDALRLRSGLVGQTS